MTAQLGIPAPDANATCWATAWRSRSACCPDEDLSDICKSCVITAVMSAKRCSGNETTLGAPPPPPPPAVEVVLVLCGALPGASASAKIDRSPLTRCRIASAASVSRRVPVDGSDATGGRLPHAAVISATVCRPGEGSTVGVVVEGVPDFVVRGGRAADVVDRVPDFVVRGGRPAEDDVSPFAPGGLPTRLSDFV
jgi:hypothetical protein